MVVSGVNRRLWLVRRMALLALRGRVRHAGSLWAGLLAVEEYPAVGDATRGAAYR